VIVFLLFVLSLFVFPITLRTYRPPVKTHGWRCVLKNKTVLHVPGPDEGRAVGQLLHQKVDPATIVTLEKY
jgi:hypothetical protein